MFLNPSGRPALRAVCSWLASLWQYAPASDVRALSELPYALLSLVSSAAGGWAPADPCRSLAAHLQCALDAQLRSARAAQALPPAGPARCGRLTAEQRALVDAQLVPGDRAMCLSAVGSGKTQVLCAVAKKYLDEWHSTGAKSNKILYLAYSACSGGRESADLTLTLHAIFFSPQWSP